MPLRQLLDLRDYPRDVMAFHVQSCSLTDFLVGRSGRAQFLSFLTRAGRDDWDTAIRTHYGYRTVADLEKAWHAGVEKARREGSPPGNATRMAPGASSSSWSGSRAATRGPRGKLPTGVAPEQVLVALDRDGMLTIWRTTTSYRGRTSMRGGRPVTTYEPVTDVREESHPLDGVAVFDTKGELVARKELFRLVKGETPALVSADGRAVDPLHLRIVKPGTLIFVLPKPAPVAAEPPTEPAVEPSETMTPPDKAQDAGERRNEE
jgi:hypothetical protein